jgi:hypothetical protein
MGGFMLGLGADEFPFDGPEDTGEWGFDPARDEFSFDGPEDTGEWGFDPARIENIIFEGQDALLRSLQAANQDDLEQYFLHPKAPAAIDEPAEAAAQPMWRNPEARKQVEAYIILNAAARRNFTKSFDAITLDTNIERQIALQTRCLALINKKDDWDTWVLSTPDEKTQIQRLKWILNSTNAAAITAACPSLEASLGRANDAERDQLVKDILKSTNAAAITAACPSLEASLGRANDAERDQLVKDILKSRNATAITTVIPYLAASLGRANDAERGQLVKHILRSTNATAITETLPYLKNSLQGTHANGWVGPILASQRAQAIALIVGPTKVVSSDFLQTWVQNDRRRISLALATRSVQVVFALSDDVLANYLVSTRKDVTSLPGGAPEERIKTIKEIMDAFKARRAGTLTGPLDEKATPPLFRSKKITFAITWKAKSVEFKIRRAGKGSGNAYLTCFNAQLTDTICKHIIKIKEDKNNLSRIKSIVADILNEDIEEYRTLDLWRDFSAGKNEELKKNIIAAIEAVVLQIHSADGSADGSNEYGRKRQRTFEPSEGGGGSASAAGGGGSASAAGGGSGFYATATVEWSGAALKIQKPQQLLFERKK